MSSWSWTGNLWTRWCAETCLWLFWSPGIGCAGFYVGSNNEQFLKKNKGRKITFKSLILWLQRVLGQWIYSLLVYYTLYMYTHISNLDWTGSGHECISSSSHCPHVKWQLHHSHYIFWLCHLISTPGLQISVSLIKKRGVCSIKFAKMLMTFSNVHIWEIFS